MSFPQLSLPIKCQCLSETIPATPASPLPPSLEFIFTIALLLTFLGNILYFAWITCFCTLSIYYLLESKSHVRLDSFIFLFSELVNKWEFKCVKWVYPNVEVLNCLGRQVLSFYMSVSQPGVILGRLAVSGNTFGCHRGREGRYWSLLEKARDAAKYPTMYSRATHSHTKVNSAEIRKLLD